MSSQPLPLIKIFILYLVTCFPEVNLRPWMKFVASPFLNLILLTQINAKLLGDTRLHTMGEKDIVPLYLYLVSQHF